MAYLKHASFFTRQRKIFVGTQVEVIETLKARAKKDPDGASAKTLTDFSISFPKPWRL